jgi:hypothetical protein
LNLDYANSGHTGFQPTLVSGANIKTVNGTSLLGSGNIQAGHIIKDEGSVLTTRTNLNFVGSAVTVTDDSSNDATVVTISGAISDGDKGDITVSSGGTVWTIDTVPPDKGGTGVANSANNTITFAGNYPLGITLASSTSITLPATGTLATLAGTETLTNKTLTSPTFTGTPTAPTATAGTNTTQIATTAMVHSAITNDLNVTGTAPMYACRAWVNFNGTGTVAIRASGNVSSITDNGVGDYTVNFITAMPDTNYTVTHATRIPASSGYSTLAMRLFGNYNSGVLDAAPLTSSFRVGTAVQGATNNSDGDYICLAIFR